MPINKNQNKIKEKKEWLRHIKVILKEQILKLKNKG